MVNNYKISIIISAYNVEEYISRCLDSVINQTYKNLEIIVINDGSIDKTKDIIEKYQENDPRIILINQNNQGLVRVRENGINLATGDYIGFVDGDDTIISTMYEKLLNNAIDTNSEISSCGMMYCFYDGRKKPMYGTGVKCSYNKIDALKNLLTNNIEPSLCNKLYSSKIIKNSCLDYDVINNEDLLRNFVLFKRANSVIHEDFCGYEYWRRDGSMSNNHRIIDIYSHIIKARELIVNNSENEYLNEAHHCFISGLLGAYCTISENMPYEFEISSFYRKRIINEKKFFFTLNKKERILVMMIIHFPYVFRKIYKIRRKYVYKKIKRQSEKIKNE